LEIVERKREGKTPASILLSIVPLKNREGKVFRLAGIGKDITELKKMEQKLLDVQKLEAIHELVVTLNHEMNQPLAVSSSLIQMMIKKMEEGIKPTSKGLEMIYKQFLKISKLLKEINEIKQIVTTDYIKGIKMIDLKKSVDKKIKEVREE